MVVQAAAVPLTVIATQMGISVPAVIEYFQGQNIDLSGYGANDLVDLETLFPETESERIKEYKTYGDSFYDAPPVVGDTSLDNIVLQTKKDDDEKITTIDQEGNVLPDLPDQMPDPNDDGPKIDINWKRLAEVLMEEAVDQTVTKLEDKFIDIQNKKKKGVNFAPEKTDNITRLHKLRLQNIIDGKTDTYPGGPQNDRIVLNGPEGSNLPPIAIGNINFEDWTNKITLSDEEIFNQKDWYKKVYESFDVVTGGDKDLRNKVARAWLSGQINESPTNALTNVLYIYEQYKRGVPFDEVKGKGLPAPTNNIKSIIYGRDIESGIGPKIADFIDAGEGLETRSIMNNDKAGGSPFVVDVHTARDTGMVDPTYLNKLEALGYIVPENIKTDFGAGGIAGTKYENRSLFGQDLTKYLNDINWKGKNDWIPAEIQAIGWMNLTKMYGELGTSGDIDMALNRNLRRLSMEVDPGEGSPWFVEYGEKYNALPDDKKFKVNEEVTAKAIEYVRELTGVDFSGTVHGTGGWELYQNPSTVQQAYMSKETAKDAAAKLAYMLNQTEVWVNTAKELTKNPNHFSLDIVEDGSENLRDSDTLKSLFERIINADPNGLFRGYQPIIVDGNAGIRIIIDKDAIKNSPLKKADILPYIQEFTQNQLNDITNDLNLDANTYISEIELEKLVNNWKKDKQGGGFKNNFSDDSSTTSEGGSRPNIYSAAKQLTKFFAKILQREFTSIEDTTKKITKKKLGGSIEIPTFHFGGFIDVNRL
jgi:hypothetical protein